MGGFARRRSLKRIRRLSRQRRRRSATSSRSRRCASKRVIAKGHVKVESIRLNIDASELSYDPVAQVLHARGSQTTRITIFDKEKGTTSTAGELEWNTATDQFRVKDLAGKVQP